ncbi:MAG: hypothetical protein ABIT58_08600 [Ferruginibacter sp.]
MTNRSRILCLSICTVALFFSVGHASAQYKSFSLSPKGDTLNVIDSKGLKQGKWVITVGELRGEPGYDEEGLYKDDKKTGVWRKYNTTGDILAVENYLFGGKDGIQQYYTFLGDLERQEEWRGYNPNAPYDTIPIYGTGSNEIISYKRVKAEQYSVPNGEWKYYEAGRMTKLERYDRGQLMKENQDDKKATAVVTKMDDAPKEKVKTKEILEYEKKYSKKKRKKMERDGQTGL